MSQTKTKPKAVKRSAEREILIQCRLSQGLHDRIQELAELQGDSIASYVRRVLRAETTRGYAQAIVIPRAELRSRSDMFSLVKPTCALRLLRQIDTRHAAYALLDKDTLEGVDFERLMKPWWPKLGEHVVVLQGMPGYYNFVGTVLLRGEPPESAPLYLELTLRAESFDAGEGMFVG